MLSFIFVNVARMCSGCIIVLFKRLTNWDNVHFYLQTDLEETKAQEISKLQDILHEMQLQVEEARSTLIREREAARKAIEEAPPVIKETPVFVQDTEKIDSLTAEVENLKVGLWI